MRRHEGWLVVATVLWLSACSTTLPRPLGPEDEVRRAAAADTRRWTGVTKLSREDCPAPGTADWKVSPLFPLHELAQDLRASARKVGLNRFCVYEYKGPAPVPELPQEISERLRSAERDRVALAGSSDPSLEALTWDPFFQRFLDQVQVPVTLPGGSATRVRLSFLDTQPREGDFGIPRVRATPQEPERSLHGYTLTHIAGHLACRTGESPCAVEIAPELALPLVGGRGTYIDLSRAIWAEVTRWSNLPQRPHLVLNLSLGWDGETFGGWEDNPVEITPNAQEIYRALEFAARQDILVIAAAGNERPGPDAKERPLLPAGWESKERFLNKTWIWKSDGEPLVYAVSGVDGQGHPLVNTRPRGEAPRVAYADHVVVPDLYADHVVETDLPNYTATLTGTSVATAVVSTIAAIVWSYRPELKPAEVMQILSTSGDFLHRTPDFFAGNASPESVRRISLCNALFQACSQSGAHCSPPVCPNPSPPGPIEPELISFDPPTSTMKILTGAPYKYTNIQDQPWIDTQPGENPCPNCTVTRNPPDERALLASTSSFSRERSALDTGDFYKLRVEIPSTWGAAELEGATLEITGFDPGTGRKVPMKYCSVETPLQGTHTLVATCAGDPAEPPFQATLSFTLRPSSGGPAWSIESPLFVEY